MFNVSLEHFLFLGAILFTLGVLGIFLNKKNVIIILMSIELILLAVNINFVAFARFGGMNFSGQVFALFVIIMAAAEAAVALAIIINVFNNLDTVNIDDARELKL